MRPLRQVHHHLLFMLAFGMVLISTALSTPCRAEMFEMSNSQMAKIHGHGATNLYIEGDSVRLFLDIHMETYGEIDSAKAGYYDKNGQTGWDMDWTGLTLGESEATPLVTDGLVFRAEFDDITASNKQLTGFLIGTNNMDGKISGEFTTTTGAVHPGVVGQTGTDPIVMKRGGYLGNYDSLDINDSGFFVNINLINPDDTTNDQRGIETIIGYPENEALNIISTTDWWQN